MPKLPVSNTYIIPAHPGTENGENLKLVVEQYSFPAITAKNAKTVNVVWSHANGFHKETLHPLMRRNIKQLRESYGDVNFEFYAWDGRNQGDSGRLNVDNLPLTFSWQDHASDIRQLVVELNLKRPHIQLIGIGHSVGATSTILCEFRYPGTFDAIIAIEPIFVLDVAPKRIRERTPMLASRKRRDEWESFEAAYTFFSKRPFWKTWDPEALELFVKYGLYETDDGKVRLKCQPEQEYAVYWYDCHSQIVAFRCLGAIRIPVHIIFGDESHIFPLSALEGIDKTAPTVNISVVSGGHIVPLEKPDLIASDILPFFKKVLGDGSEQTLQSKL
ncbi:Alpha/Beta hydrolase protein [Umbelopsis sp. AD052]|nr:Alpha/Beta hydrolase protein [Umbelopsis sp. AD052]